MKDLKVKTKIKMISGIEGSSLNTDYTIETMIPREEQRKLVLRIPYGHEGTNILRPYLELYFDGPQLLAFIQFLHEAKNDLRSFIQK